MGAIQQAINQGITTAAILGQLNELPQARKEKKTAKSLGKMATEQGKEIIGDMSKNLEKIKNGESADMETFNDKVSAYNELVGLTKEAGKKVALRSADTELYNAAVHLKSFPLFNGEKATKQYDAVKGAQAMAKAQEQLALAKQQKEKRKSLLDLPLTIGNEDFGTLRDLPVDMRKQARGELRNGRK